MVFGISSLLVSTLIGRFLNLFYNDHPPSIGIRLYDDFEPIIIFSYICRILNSSCKCIILWITLKNYKEVFDGLVNPKK